ncbi:MAG: TonB-dependent receptor [Spirochaetaceae bacterium]|jgi:vitamin B12 transporter|nr:TonB-dependent receptor [Spirochaetaceae bacterium]
MRRIFIVLIGCILSLYSVHLAFSQTDGGELDAVQGESFFDEYFPLMEDEEGLTVVGTRESVQQMKTITKEDIERIQPPDLAALLQETLNIGVVRRGGYGNAADINMRGFDSDRIAFLINGIPANSARSGDFEISQIDLNSIERIEVIYGGSDSKYNVSGALGGVINIITIKKRKRGLSLSGGVSNVSMLPGKYYEKDGRLENPHWEDLADAQNINFSGGYSAETFSASAGIFANRAENHFLYWDKYFDTTRRKTNNEMMDIGASVSFIKDFAGLSKLILSGDIYNGDKNIPTSAYAEIHGKQKDFYTRQNIMLDMPAFRDNMALEASLSHNWEVLGYEPPTGASSLHDEHDISAINRWSWDALTGLTLRAGWDYRYTTLDSTEIGKRSQNDGGLYLTCELSPTEKFLIIPSIKTVFNSNSVLSVVPVPKLGFAWFASPDLTIKNNYFRSFKYPAFNDLYWPAQGEYAGNPDLKPEDGWGADLGAYFRYKIINIESSFFAQYTNDSIHWAANGGVWRPSNVGEAAFFGFDGKISVDIPLSKGPFKKIIPAFSYQGMVSRLLSYGYGFADEKRIPYIPDVKFVFSVDIPWKNGSLLISANYEGKRYTDTVNSASTALEPVFLLNLNVNQKINDNLNFFAGIRNLLNTGYESFAEYPMPGITVTLGARVNFESIGEHR